MATQLDAEGKVLAVQSIPFEDVAATVEVEPDMATNTPFPKPIAVQFVAEGKVLWVHVIPSGDVAAIRDDPNVMATNTPLP